MRAADALYPGYGFASHVGLHHAAHTRIVRERGRAEIHRRSWRARAYLPLEDQSSPRNDANGAPPCWYRLRALRILDANCCWREASSTSSSGAAADRVLRGEVEDRRRVR